MALTPKQIREFSKSKRAWGRYRDLLEKSYDRSINPKLITFLRDSQSTTRKQFLNRLDGFIKEQRAVIQTALNAPTGDAIESLIDAQLDSVAINQPRIATEFAGSIDSISANIIANTETDIGNGILKGLDLTDAKLKLKLKDADRLIRLGEIEGSGIEEVVRDIKQNVIGLKPYQRTGGAVSSIRTEVRTAMGNLNYDIMSDFGRRTDGIIGEKIQRGPGPCDKNICGVLGVPPNGIAYFIYGKNDPPQLLLHYNSFAAVIGYIFDDDPEGIAKAGKWKPQPGYKGAYAKYKESRVVGRDYMAENSARLLKLNKSHTGKVPNMGEPI